MIKWNDIRGQRRPLDILERALGTGRVHHAYLFAGLEGVGKFATALAFAAAINCAERPEHSFRPSCGRCKSCRGFSRLQHPDLMPVSPDGTRIKIDQIREVQRASSRAPHEARYRMVLINDAHKMTEPAANALLKTLEEPQSRMRLILITDQPHNLLDTIISRCQILRFGALPLDDVVDLLADLTARSDDFEQPVDRPTLRVAAGYGEGSPGRSFEVLASGMLAARAALIDALLALTPGEPVALLDFAEDLAETRDSLHRNLDVIKQFLRDVMVFQASEGRQALTNRDLGPRIQQLAHQLSPRAVLDLLDVIKDSQARLARNVNGRLIAEQFLETFRSARQPR